MHIHENDLLNVYFLASHHMYSGLTVFVRGNNCKQLIQLSVCLCDREAAKQLLTVCFSFLSRIY